MSYILDALKKSEQERSRRDAQGAVVPSAVENSDQPSEDQPRRASAQAALAEHTSSTNTASSNKARFSVSLVLLGMLAVVVTAAILIVNSNARPDAPQEIGARTPLATSATATPVQPERKTEQSSVEAPVETSRIPPPANVLPAKDKLKQVEPTNTDRAPFEALERIPDLVITAHKYSSVPENRSVTMNGRTWREGDSVVDGVILKEITRDGLALDVAGWPVVVGRSRGWKAIK